MTRPAKRHFPALALFLFLCAPVRPDAPAFLAVPRTPESPLPPPGEQILPPGDLRTPEAADRQLTWNGNDVARIPAHQSALFEAAARHGAIIRTVPPRCGNPDQLWLAVHWPPDPPGVSPSL